MCVFFGFSIACFVTLRSVITVQLLGLEKLNSGFGLVLLLQGLAALVGTPFTGSSLKRVPAVQQRTHTSLTASYQQVGCMTSRVPTTAHSTLLVDFSSLLLSWEFL